jgi:uncharacterized protein (TIGR00255 family)
MTGYGLATRSSSNYQISVELKSLNSKFFEVNIKLPRAYVKYESKLRNEMTRRLQRGKIVMNVEIEVLNPAKRTLNINKALAAQYTHELQALADELGLQGGVSLSILMGLPEILPTEVAIEDPEEWSLIEEACLAAMDALQESRREEGTALDADLSERVQVIQEQLAQIQQLAPGRLDHVRQRLRQAVEELKNRLGDADPARFDQEVLYYIEKLDINEEIVRLKQHLAYFQELKNDKLASGKQLQFISQEMGREINTIGAKANDAVMQRLVVVMKDELEKIKEQVMNVV